MTDFYFNIIMNDSMIKNNTHKIGRERRTIARKIRAWFPGAVYHIMHRGVRRKTIFEDETDYQVFLQILKTSLEKYNCILHAYCLMTNHIHLLVETGDVEIGKFKHFGVRPHKEKINISKEFINKTR